jgi:hypothetical protein
VCAPGHTYPIPGIGEAPELRSDEREVLALAEGLRDDLRIEGYDPFAIVRPADQLTLPESA